MYNENPYQKIGDRVYVYGTPINPNGNTTVITPTGEQIVVIGTNNNGNVTFAKATPGVLGFGTSYDNSTMQTLSSQEMSKLYTPTTNNSAPANAHTFNQTSSTIEQRVDGYYVDGKKIEYNKPIKLADGKYYVFNGIAGDSVSYAQVDHAVDENTLNILRNTGAGYDADLIEQTLAPNVAFKDYKTAKIQDFNTTTVTKDSNGDIYVYGVKATPGSIVRDKDGYPYVVESIDGNNVKMAEVELNGFGDILYVGREVDISADGGAGSNKSPTDSSKSPVDTPATSGSDTTGSDTSPMNTGSDDTKSKSDTSDSTKSPVNEETDDSVVKVDGVFGADTTDDKKEDTDKISGKDTKVEDKVEEKDGVTVVATDTKTEKETEPPKINEYTTRADGYKETNYLKADYEHGLGVKDNGNVGNQDKAIKDFDAVFYDEKVQEKFNEFNGGSPTIHAGEGISHHHHQTEIGSAEYNGKKVSYLPGELIALAGDPTKLSEVTPFREMYEQNIDKNIIGKVPDNGKKWSTIEYAAAFASSGQYSYQDSLLAAKALQAKNGDNFVQYTGPYFKGTGLEKFDDLIDETGKNAQKMSQELEDDVNELIDGWKKIHELLDGMSGEAKNAYDLYTVQCVQGKFEVAMGNINSRLKPACVALTLLFANSNLDNITGIEDVKLPPDKPESLSFVPNMAKDAPLLKQLKLGEQELKTYTGEGEEKKDPNLKDLVDKIKEKNKELNTARNSLNSLGSRPSDKLETNALGEEIPGTNIKKADQLVWDNKHADLQRKISTLENDLSKLEATKKELEEKIEKYTEELNKVFEYAATLLDFVNKYATYRQTYRKYVLPGGEYSDGELNIYKLITEGDIKDLVNGHDAIIHGFEDFEKMPQISNKSDYRKGDVVLYDDAHGYIYVVGNDYDPLTGELKILCYDRNGNQVGSEIVVWDQREITPIAGIRDIPNWHEYDSIPDRFEDTKPPKDTIPNTIPRTNPGTNPPTVPATTVPPTVPATTIPPTNPSTVPQTIETTPDINIITIPDTNPNSIPETIPHVPVPPTSPHTGLDAIYGSGETKQSAAGLGALAGLAAGAAGLGLTGLIKDDKDEEEDEDEELQMTEEEKPLEEKKEENETKEETKEEEDTSNPQFF